MDEGLAREAAARVSSAPEDAQSLTVVLELTYETRARRWVLAGLEGAHSRAPRRLAWEHGLDAYGRLHVRRPGR